MRVTEVHRAAARAFSGLRLRTQLLLVVNAVVGVAASGMLYLDYRASIDGAVERTAASLEDEARALAEALDVLEHLGPEAVQNHLDAVCAAMNAGTSPGHEITARVATTGRLYAASHAHVAESEHAPRISGTASRGSEVTVSELAHPVLADARHDALWRIGALLGGAVLAAVLVNFLLLRLVTSPLEGLVANVRSFGETSRLPKLAPPSNAEIADLSAGLGGMMRELASRELDREAQLFRARRLQDHLMVNSSHEADVVVEYHPADQIAGDYVDVVKLPGGGRLFCLADVVGHGIPAAMGAAVIKALVVSLDASDLTPAALLKRLNVGVFRASLPEDFATMIVVRVPACGGPVIYASAGHETCYAVRDEGRVSELSSTGMLLGVDPTAEFEDVELDLDLGDVLVLMSDGLSEAMNRDGEFLGRARLLSELSSLECRDARCAAESVLASAQRHLDGRVASDDMTVVAIAVSTASQPEEITSCDTF